MKVPKGTSDYQAIWIKDDAEEEEDDDDDVDSCDDDEDGMMDDEMDGDNESQVSFYYFDTSCHKFLMKHFLQRKIKLQPPLP